MPDMPDASNWFAPVPEARRRAFPRTLRDGPRIEAAGRRLVNFASNDYLGLASHPEVVEAAVRALCERGLGAGASRLVSGDDPALHAFERELARWKGYGACLLLGSGMLANIGLLDALAGREARLFGDRLNHASLVDGARLARGRLHRYPHLDLAALERLLARRGSGRNVIVSDGVFSMDGDCADVRGLLELAERRDAIVVLDDAHGLGVLGPEGRGLAAEAGCAGHPRLVEVGTCGKALGGYGAFILGPAAFIEGLRQRLRTMIYSTALPPALPAASMAALAVLRRERLSERLQARIRHFLRAAGEACLPLLPSRTAIQPLVVGADEAALAASAALRERGFFVPAIRPPTVPEGTARLRITISAAHEEAELDALVAALAEVAGGRG